MKPIFRHETAEQMRQRLQRRSFWSSVFWAGANGGRPVSEADPGLREHLENEQLQKLKKN